LGHLPLLGQLTRSQRRAWLRRVLKNLFIDQCRRSAREQQLLSQLEPQSASPEVDELLPLQIEGLLNTLPVPLRELWRRRYGDGMSGIELARALGVPPATVRSRLHAARKLLRRRIECTLWLEDGEATLYAQRLAALDGTATLWVGGELVIDAAVSPSMLAEKLAKVHNHGTIICTPAQMGALHQRIGENRGELRDRTAPEEELPDDGGRRIGNTAYLAL